MAKSKRKAKVSDALTLDEQHVLHIALSVPEGTVISPDTGDEEKSIASLIKRRILAAAPAQPGRFPGATLAIPRAHAATHLVNAQFSEPMEPFDQVRALDVWAQRGPQNTLSTLSRGEEAYVRWHWYQQPGTQTQADVFFAIMNGVLVPPTGGVDMRAAAEHQVASDPSLQSALHAAQRDGFSGDAAELAAAVVDHAARAGMPLVEISARPWTAVRVFEELLAHRQRVDSITSDTR